MKYTALLIFTLFLGGCSGLRLTYDLDCVQCGKTPDGLISTSVSPTVHIPDDQANSLAVTIQNVSDSTILLDASMFTLLYNDTLAYYPFGSLNPDITQTNEHYAASYSFFSGTSEGTTVAVKGEKFIPLPPHATLVYPSLDYYYHMYKVWYSSSSDRALKYYDAGDYLKANVVGSKLTFTIYYKLASATNWKTTSVVARCNSAVDR
ncbi:MAG TPA: hypothetical protein VFA55_03685 [Candidatus Kapabacteria bacterium]|nr:hypothetical protein [Candidatus Kapabacteria bacterium]